MSALGGNPDGICSLRAFPLLTQSDAWPGRNPAAQQSPAVAELCYPFGRKHGGTAAVKRREFISLLGGAAAWPLAASAQQGERVRRIVFLHALAENDPETLKRVAVFRQALEALGWTERNPQIEHRFFGGDFAKIQADAAEIVRAAPDLIVGSSTAIIGVLKQVTRTVPIVFALVTDPVGQ